MATLVQITGAPSTGKSRGVKELDPKTTFYIDADKKGLPWAGWKKSYSAEAKNYIKTSDLDTIRAVLASINTKAPHIKTVVIDTINGILTDKVMLDMKKASFDEFNCRIKIPLIAGISLEVCTLQSNHETWISLNV